MTLSPERKDANQIKGKQIQPFCKDYPQNVFCSMLHKIFLYISSMSPFFLIVFILSFSPCENVSQQTIYCDVSISIIRWNCAGLFIVGLLYFVYMEFVRKPSSFNQSIEISHYESLSYENLSFLASYFVPLVSFNLLYLSHTIVMILLVICIGIIFIQSGKYYTNPTLALFGYRVYYIAGRTKAFEDSNRKNVSYTIITRGTLENVRWLKTLKIEEGFYYSKVAES